MMSNIPENFENVFGDWGFVAANVQQLTDQQILVAIEEGIQIGGTMNRYDIDRVNGEINDQNE